MGWSALVVLLFEWLVSILLYWFTCVLGWVSVWMLLNFVV